MGLGVRGQGSGVRGQGLGVSSWSLELESGGMSSKIFRNSDGWQKTAGPCGPFGVRAVALSQPDRFATGASR